MPSKKGRPRIERRKSTRADASLSMRVEGRPDDGELTKIVTESQNISANGVYCSSPHFLAPLSKVALTIVLPNHSGASASPRLLKCEGVVVRCRPRDAGARQGYELACSFLSLDPRQRGLLDDYVARRNLQGLRAGVNGPARKTSPGSRARPRAARPTAASRKQNAARPRRGPRSTGTRRSAGR